jgi:lipopolysaccharide/colanic/teichoic acid biosynthesis glycosyltransferase
VNLAIKRCYDLTLASASLLLTAGIFAIVAILIRLEDGGPVFFRQRRVGQYGRPFRILKFRTMIVDADRQGPSLTRHKDDRITRVGAWLRRTKLDELPQLWNVLRGEMSLVGPRPELPRYVERYTPAQREVLAFKPGLTDLASLAFRNEAELFPSDQDPENFYLSHCVPQKIALSLEHARRSNLWFDTSVILKSFLPPRRPRPQSGKSTPPF